MKDNTITIYPELDTGIRQKSKGNDSKRTRCETEINASILEICADGGIGRTHIMYKANLSHAMLISYLTKLLKCGLLEINIDDSKSKIKITEKGREYLYHYLLMQKLVESRDTD